MKIKNVDDISEHGLCRYDVLDLSAILDELGVCLSAREPILSQFSDPHAVKLSKANLVLATQTSAEVTTATLLHFFEVLFGHKLGPFGRLGTDTIEIARHAGYHAWNNAIKAGAGQKQMGMAAGKAEAKEIWKLLPSASSRTSLRSVQSMKPIDQYEDMTDEDHDRILRDIVGDLSAATILNVPGVYEILSEHFNEQILSNWEAEHEESS